VVDLVDIPDAPGAAAGPTRVAGALADVARLGGYATVLPDVTGVPVARLHGPGALLGRRIARVRSALACDDRVAASIAFQGFAASLVTPPLATAVVHGLVPALPPDALHWEPTGSGPWRQSCANPAGRPVPGTEEAAAALAEALVEPHLAPLVAAVRARTSVSARVLWGNAASAVAGAKRLVAVEWPEHAGRAADVAAGLLETGPFAGLGEFRPPRPPDHGWTYRRRTCCLIHRAPAGGLCGDCVLLPPG
jgi:ferric iron reductase protein FhuF